MPWNIVDRAIAVARLSRGIDTVKTGLATLHVARLRDIPDLVDVREAEFRAFSQFGEDGILLYILSRTKNVTQRFVEFGVEDYSEASTRVLAELGGWSGLVMDANQRKIARLRRTPIMWRSPLSVRSAFITAENIGELLIDSGFHRDVGVMVIDIDGNEYWIWDALPPVRPTIIVAEYNALWGVRRSVTVPYDARFDRWSAHASGLWAGASLPALQAVATSQGYRLVAVNSHANNAFFVHSTTDCTLPTLEIASWMGQPGFQQARALRGRLTFEGDARALQRIGHLPLVDVLTKEHLTVANLLDTDGSHDRQH